MATPHDIKRYRRNLQGEIDGALLYHAMASNERSAHLADVYRKLAAIEEKHAGLWRDELRKAGVSVPEGPSLRARVMSWVARLLGPGAVLPSMAIEELQGRGMYDHQPE